MPLSVLPANLPDRDDVAGLQLVIDGVQPRMDRRPSLAARVALLTKLMAHGPAD